MHKLFYKIKKRLDEEKIDYEEFHHQSVRTSEEAAKIRDGYELADGAKALIVKCDDRLVMLVVAADKRFDSKMVKKQVGCKDLRFANEEEVLRVTGGVKPGGVPPLGNLFGLETFFDQEIMEKERVVFNAGDRRASIAMAVVDLVGLVGPKVKQLVRR